MAIHHNTLEPTPGLVIKIPWDSNTFRGFVGALTFLLLCFLFGPYLEVKPVVLVRPEVKTIPIDVMILHFGNGDGSGGNRGNLADEGPKAKGKTLASTLSNTSAPKTSTKPKIAKANVTHDLTAHVTPVKSKPEKPSETKKKKEETENTSTKKTAITDNTSSIVKGDSKGTDNGTGRGNLGNGPGAGKGWGDIDWGGGGNTTVLHKQDISIPNGLNNSTNVKIRFTITPEGDIGDIICLTRGVPIAESAVKAAFRKWKFKAPASKTPLTGTITVRFEIN